MHTPNMLQYALYLIFLVFLIYPLLTQPGPTCTQPMIELDGIEAPFSPKPILSYVFQVRRPARPIQCLIMIIQLIRFSGQGEGFSSVK